jgi:heat-inducible transcriptional repressor
MLDTRTEHILAAAIQEFIRTGEPVSSGHLYDRYDFGIKPAMIRLVLKDLDDAGYLEQPNYSAGRVPSDRGYEFFADYALNEDTPPAAPGRELIASLERHAWADMLHEMSRELGLMSAVTRLAASRTYKTGLEMLIDHMDWDSRSDLKAVIRDFEALDGRIEETKQELAREEDVQVFIGRKSPVTRCAQLSVVASEIEIDGDRMLLFAIGPKRMDYQRTARMFKNLKEAAQKKEMRNEK